MCQCSFDGKEYICRTFHAKLLKGQQPCQAVVNNLFVDETCEELSFPVLFPKGRFGYTIEQDIKLSPIKYFNARLLHYGGKFATNPEYLFFAQFIMEQKKISDSINIALKKYMGSQSQHHK